MTEYIEMPSPGQRQEGDRGYIAMFNGRRTEVYAKTLLDAHVKAGDRMKVPAKQRYKMITMLAEDSNGKPVVHTAVN